jgi:hypothetical protein
MSSNVDVFAMIFSLFLEIWRKQRAWSLMPLPREEREHLQFHVSVSCILDVLMAPQLKCVCLIFLQSWFDRVFNEKCNADNFSFRLDKDEHEIDKRIEWLYMGVRNQRPRNKGDHKEEKVTWHDCIMFSFTRGSPSISRVSTQFQYNSPCTTTDSSACSGLSDLTPFSHFILRNWGRLGQCFPERDWL